MHQPVCAAQYSKITSTAGKIVGIRENPALGQRTGNAQPARDSLIGQFARLMHQRFVRIQSLPYLFERPAVYKANRGLRGVTLCHFLQQF